MGMDPIGVDETYEVTIQLEGPVNPQDFVVFRQHLQDFIAAFLPDPATGSPGVPNHHPNHKPGKQYLQVRESRASQRKNLP